MYARCLLRELGKPDDFDQWVKDVVEEGKDGLGNFAGVGELFGHLLKKVKVGEQWQLPPESRYGSSDRAIAQTHPKEIKFALQAAFDAALSQKNGRVLERGHLVSYAAYKELDKLHEPAFRTDFKSTHPACVGSMSTVRACHPAFQMACIMTDSCHCSPAMPAAS